MGVGADRARQFTDTDGRPGAHETVAVADELREPQRQLESEGHWLGVHAMRAPNHRGSPILVRAVMDRSQETVEVGEQQVARLTHLQRVRGGSAVRPDRRGRL